jgi:apolipoprotein N-acyltransferase
LFWAASRTRLAAFLLWLGYYLAGARDVPVIFTSFFPESWSGWGGVVWLIHAALLALPWVILWREKPTPQRAILSAAAALLVTTLPPLGILGWLSPLLLAGEAFPGTGWIGLGLTFCILVLLAGCARKHWRALVLLSVVATSTSLAVNTWYTPPRTPDGWIAIDTALGDYPKDRAAAYHHHQALMRAVEAKLNVGAKVIVLPEGIVGLWRAGSQFWWRDIDQMARERNATVVLGADLPADGERYFNGVALLGATAGALRGRVPMPIGVWRPGQEVGGVPDLLGSGTTHLHGIQVAYSICYEDFLIYPMLLSSLDKPRAIISLSNNWFADDLDAVWIQRRSIENQARLFGLSLVRAVNLASTIHSSI